MFPIIFRFFGLKVYAYGLLIGLGIAIGVLYLFKVGKKQIGLTETMINNLVIYIIVAAFVGGKVFLFFENPKKYASSSGLLLSGSGFVFYGSLIFCFGVLFWFMRKHKLPQRLMLDIIAVVTCIVHIFGRVGCFMAGCCFGTPYEGALGVVYTNTNSSAPLNCALHPVQLYEASAIFLLLIILLVLKQFKRFEGQLFVTYLFIYPIIRIITETFRGDEERGYLFNGIISHSQFISLFIMLLGLYLFFKWRNTTSVKP